MSPAVWSSRKGRQAVRFLMWLGMETGEKNGDSLVKQEGCGWWGGCVLQVEAMLLIGFQGNLSPEQLLTHKSCLWLTVSFSISWLCSVLTSIWWGHSTFISEMNPLRLRKCVPTWDHTASKWQSRGLQANSLITKSTFLPTVFFPNLV